MFQPKRQKTAKTKNQGIAWIISLFLTIPALISGIPAAASTDSFDAASAQKYSIDKADSLWVVVNKHRPLSPITYAPVLGKFEGISVAKIIVAPLTQMTADMLKAGAGSLILNSGYRSYDEQAVQHTKMIARWGFTAGEAAAARPGYSEHQTGLAVDVRAAGQPCAIYPCFSRTKAGMWLAANSWRYGFILRYQSGESAITGYQFEPWHFRYVGVDLATQIKNKGMPALEKFWNLPAAPSYAN